MKTSRPVTYAGAVGLTDATPMGFVHVRDLDRSRHFYCGVLGPDGNLLSVTQF